MNAVDTSHAPRGGPRSGDILGGKYLLEERLGVGGFGEVYRATNVSLGRKVAIKLLGADMAGSEDDVLRFLREARAAAAVRHPNVVDVLDVARDDDGTPFIVQELLSGEDLERYAVTRGGRLSVEETLAILLPVAEAVAAAHERGVVHRDLKPANVFLSRSDGRITPKVLDFGACIFSTLAESGEREMRVVLGTPHYMAPEQLSPNPVVDARADVWALGIMLWEMAVGEAPFEAATAHDVIQLVKTRTVPRLETRLRDVPKPFADLVAACTQRDVDLRPTNGRALLARMRQAADDVRLLLHGRHERAGELDPTPPEGVTPLTAEAAAVRLELDDRPAPPRRVSSPDLRSSGTSLPPVSRASQPSLPPVVSARPPTASRAFLPAPPPPGITWTRLRRPAGIAFACALAAHVVLRFVPVVTAPLGAALRGDSPIASGALAVLVLVATAILVVRAVSASGRPRSLAFSAAAGVVFSMTMIIVTFAASETELGTSPPSGLVPFLAPLLPGCLAYLALGRADAALAEHERSTSLRFLVLAGLAMLGALEAGPTGAAHRAAQGNPAHLSR